MTQSSYPIKIVVWEITYKCNAKCIHCGSDCTSKEKPNVLNTGQCLEIIKDLKEIGTDTVILSGGEPLLREDIPELVKALNDANIKVGIISNSIAVNKKNIEMIKQMNLSGFGISIDAGEAYLHDYIRGRKGTFSRVLNAINLLNENDIPISVVTTIHKINFTQLPKIRDLLIKNNIRMWQIQYADFIGRMPKEAMITEAQYFELSKFIYDQKTNYKDQFEIVTGADVMGYMSDYATYLSDNCWNGCHAGMGVLGLGSDGAVRGCLSLQKDEYIEGYTTQKRLIDIWNDENSFSYNRKFNIDMLTGYCKECQHAMKCKSGCIRTATCENNCRCAKYCLYKLEKVGYSSTEEARTEFSKDEIAQIYNKVSPLPKEFWEQ